MKATTILLCLFFCTLVSLRAQVTTETEEVGKPAESGEVFTVVEQMPTFPGGEVAWANFLDKNMVYPKFAMEKGIQGKVWLSFVIDKEGNVTNVEVRRGIGGGCDEEAVRVVSLSPKWNPGMQSGKPVMCKFNFPINFTLR